MITEPDPTPEQQAKTLRQSRVLIGAFAAVGIGFLAIGASDLLSGRRGLFVCSQVVLGVAYLGVAWFKWSRAGSQRLT